MSTRSEQVLAEARRFLVEHDLPERLAFLVEEPRGSEEVNLQLKVRPEIALLCPEEEVDALLAALAKRIAALPPPETRSMSDAEYAAEMWRRRSNG